MKYRIMIEGEDGTLFCFENNLDENLDEKIIEAKEQYPCGYVFVEKELNRFEYYD